MVKKGDYIVARQDPEDDLRGAKDYSFAACIASLLVFLAICVIIILATYPWMSNKWNNKQNNDGEGDANDRRYLGLSPKNASTTLKPHDDNGDQNPDNEVYNLDVRNEHNETTTEPAIDGRNENVGIDQSSTTKQTPTTQKSERSGKALFAGEISSSTSKSTVLQDTADVASSSTTTNEPQGAQTTTPIITTTAEVVSTTESAQQDDINKCIPESSTEEKVCTSQFCNAFVGRMLSLMDVSADPCTNFYKYACGGLQNREVSESNPTLRMEERIRTGLNQVSDAKSTSLRRRFFKTFYDDCLEYEHNFDDTQRLEKAKAFMKTIGEFSQIQGDADRLTKLLVTFFKHNSAPLFDIMLDVSDDGRDAPFTLKLVPPLSQHSILDASVNINAAKCFVETKPMDEPIIDLDKNYEQYKNCKHNDADFTSSVKEVLLKMGVFDGLGHDSNAIDALILEIIMTLEDLLRSKILADSQISDQDIKISMLTKEYAKYTVDELQGSFSMVNWEQLFKEVLGVNSSQITSNNVVQVYSIGYFKQLFDNIDMNTEKTKVPDALLAIFAHSLYSDLVKTSGNCDRPKMCLNLAKNFMDDVASEMYLSTFSDSRVVALSSKLDAMFKKENDVLYQRILSADWTNEQSKKNKLAEKLSKMSVKVGSKAAAAPKYFNEDDVNADFFNKIIILLKRRRIRMYADFKKSSKTSGHDQIWSHFSLPTKTSANAVYGLNSIVLPLGMMTSPFYFTKVPNYVNMGKIGSIIAHEIIHHFDATGINYDSAGKRIARDKSDYSYEKIFQHVSDSFSQTFSSDESYTKDDGTIVKYRLNPELTKNERFADVGALDLAYETYLEWRKSDGNATDLDLPYLKYTWQKVFFISNAQMLCDRKDFLDYRVALFEEEHLPAVIRVNKIPTNSVYFRETFSCKAPTRKP